MLLPVDHYSLPFPTFPYLSLPLPTSPYYYLPDTRQREVPWFGAVIETTAWALLSGQ